MRWRQVVLLYVVLAVLGVTWWQGGAPVTDGGAPAGAVRRRFLPVEPGAVEEVILERAGRTIHTRRERGRWTVVDPTDAPIPADLVAAFTNALAGAEEIERVAGTEADLASFGLADGAVRVELRAAGGPPVVVALGATNASGTAIYARRDGSPEVVLIGRNIRYYEDMLFQALPAGQAPGGSAPVG